IAPVRVLCGEAQDVVDGFLSDNPQATRLLQLPSVCLRVMPLPVGTHSVDEEDVLHIMAKQITQAKKLLFLFRFQDSILDIVALKASLQRHDLCLEEERLKVEARVKPGMSKAESRQEALFKQ
ncbi:MAG: hypothetical protein ACYTGH_08235, partial [Planctomycetota bacterium]